MQLRQRTQTRRIFFSPTLSNRVFKEYSEHFEAVSNVFPIPKSFKAFQTGFQRVSKGFQKGFKAFPKGFQRVSKGFQIVSKAFKSVSKGFPKAFKAFSKGFQRVSNPLKPGFQRVSERPQTPWKMLLWIRRAFVWRVTNISAGLRFRCY